MVRLWSTLSEDTKKKYKREGVTPQRYNAWQKLTKRQRTIRSRKAGGRREWLKAGATGQTTANGTRSQGAPAPAVVTGGPLQPGQVTAMLQLALNGKGIRKGQYDPATIAKGVDIMTPAEMAEAMTLDVDEYRDRASAPGWRHHSREGVMWNPYWYRGGAPG